MAIPLNTKILISNFKMSYNLLRRPDGTFNRVLDEFLDRKVPPSAIPKDGVYTFDVIVDRSSGLLCRIFMPASTPDGSQPASAFLSISMSMDPISSPYLQLPVIIFFHGGSFAHSSVNSAIYDVLCRRLVKYCDVVVVSVDYRRAPENRYPCAYDDGWAALQWVISRPWLMGNGANEEKEGRNLLKKQVDIFLAGDSSGGNIAHHVALKAAMSGIKIAGNILINPLFGGEKRMDSEIRLDGKYFVTIADRDWYWRAFLPEGENRDHQGCNPFGPNATSLKGLSFPKSLVVVSGLDMIQDWHLEYVEGLKREGQDVKLMYLENATIGFYLLPNTEYFYLLMEELKNFVNLKCSSS